MSGDETDTRGEAAPGGVLVRGSAGADAFRVLTAITTGAVDEARARHGTTPVATAALGRAMTGALLLTGLQKGAQQVTVVVKGDGPLGEIVADADPDGGVRGYVASPGVLLPVNDDRIPVEDAVGRGVLVVTRWLEARREPFHGTVSLVTGGVARDLAEYLLRSEQVPSVVGLGERLGADGTVLAAGGYLIQALPGSGAALAERIESRVAALPPPSTLLAEVAGDARALARRVSEGAGDYRPLAATPVRFRCRCSRERGRGALVALGAEGLRQLLEEQAPAEVSCRFCGEVYRFDAETIGSALEMLGSA